MKYLYIDVEINSENAYSIFNFINHNEGDLTIGLRSIGGESPLALFLVDVLNLEKERIHLIAINICFSSALTIFLNYKGDKSLIHGTVGMYHYAVIRMDIDETGQPADASDMARMVDIKGTRIEHEKVAKEIFNKEELEEFHKRKPVYLSFKRMKQIFPNAEIIGA